jgi:hypothetical protein
MKLAEKALCELQGKLAREVEGVDRDSLKIQAGIERDKPAGPSRGDLIRWLYGAVGLVFVLGIIYAAVVP